MKFKEHSFNSIGTPKKNQRNGSLTVSYSGDSFHVMQPIDQSQISNSSSPSQKKRRNSSLDKMSPEEYHHILEIILRTVAKDNTLEGGEIDWKEIRNNQEFKDIIEPKDISVASIQKWFSNMKTSLNRKLKEERDKFLEDAERDFTHMTYLSKRIGATEDNDVVLKLHEEYHALHQKQFKEFIQRLNVDILSMERQSLSPSEELVYKILILHNKPINTVSDLYGMQTQTKRKRQKHTSTDSLNSSRDSDAYMRPASSDRNLDYNDQLELDIVDGYTNLEVEYANLADYVALKRNAMAELAKYEEATKEAFSFKNDIQASLTSMKEIQSELLQSQSELLQSQSELLQSNSKLSELQSEVLKKFDQVSNRNDA